LSTGSDVLFESYRDTNWPDSHRQVQKAAAHAIISPKVHALLIAGHFLLHRHPASLLKQDGFDIGTREITKLAPHF